MTGDRRRFFPPPALRATSPKLPRWRSVEGEELGAFGLEKVGKSTA